VTSPQLVTVRRRLADLQHYPGNARRGDTDVLTGNHTMDAAALACIHCPHTLSRHGAGDCPACEGLHTAWETGGGDLSEIPEPAVCPGFAAHEELDVVELDVDDDAARRIVLADNRTSDLGGYDERALLTLLRKVGEDLEGTAFDMGDYDDLLASLEEADALDPPQPTGAPAGTAGAYGPDSDGTNMRATRPQAEYLEDYSSRATRFMALNYPLAQYAWIVGHLSTISDEEGVDNFAEAVLRLVEARTGETAPPVEDGQVIGGPPSPEAVELEEAPSGG
jgi:hypothetical protein